MTTLLDTVKAAILGSLAAAPLAWQSPDELAGHVGFPAERVQDELADLELAGLVEAWEMDGCPPVVTLTPVAAEALDVELVEAGRDQHPRWQPRAKVEPRPIRAGGPFKDYYSWNLRRFLPPALPTQGSRACA